MYGSKKLKDYLFSKVTHQKNLLDNVQKINESKIEQLTSRIQEQEKIIFDGDRHARNLNDIIVIEREARKHIQEVFDRQSS